MVQETPTETGRPLTRSGVIDLGAIFEIARARPLIVSAMIAVGLALALAYIHVAPKKYAVKMLLTPSETTAKESESDLSALTSLAGISLGGGGSSKFRIFLGALHSPAAAEVLMANPDIVREIFPQEWSAAEGRWREPRSLVHRLAMFLGFAPSPWSPPSTSRVYEYLEREFKVTADSKSGVVTLEIDSYKPALAARILAVLNQAIDNLIRERDLTHADSYVDYLTQRLSTTTVEDYRKPLIFTLTEQEKKRMVASSPLPYVSDVLGNPMVSAKPVAPSPALDMAVGIVLGGLLGVGLAARAQYRGSHARAWSGSGRRTAGFATGAGHQ